MEHWRGLWPSLVICQLHIVICLPNNFVSLAKVKIWLRPDAIRQTDLTWFGCKIPFGKTTRASWAVVSGSYDYAFGHFGSPLASFKIERTESDTLTTGFSDLWSLCKWYGLVWFGHQWRLVLNSLKFNCLFVDDPNRDEYFRGLLRAAASTGRLHSPCRQFHTTHRWAAVVSHSKFKGIAVVTELNSWEQQTTTSQANQPNGFRANQRRILEIIRALLVRAKGVVSGGFPHDTFCPPPPPMPGHLPPSSLSGPVCSCPILASIVFGWMFHCDWWQLHYYPFTGMNIFVAFFLLLLLLADSTPPAASSVPLIGRLN